MTGRPPTPRTVKTCELPGCGKSFEVTSGKAQQAKRFCGRDCSNKATAEARGAAYRASHGYVKPTCPCGKTVEPTPGKRKLQYAYTKKYCSAECRTKYMVRKQADPTNYRTRRCANETCGKEFTRYVKYGNGDTRFCSNACAAKHTKTRRFYAVEGFDIVFESSYEVLFWGMCMISKLPIERFDRERGVHWNTEHADSWYAPDFWLPTLEIAIECKGLQGPEDEAKWAAFRQAGGHLEVFTREDLESTSPHEVTISLREASRVRG